MYYADIYTDLGEFSSWDINNNDILFSTWSNSNTVYRKVVIDSVLVQHDNRIDNMHEGNLVVSWQGERLDGCTFELYRKECGQQDGIQILSNYSGIVYIDMFNNGELRPFQCYQYTVVPVDINGVGGKSASGMNYCNRAPVIENIDLGFIADTASLCISNEWRESVGESIWQEIEFHFKDM